MTDENSNPNSRPDSSTNTDTDTNTNANDAESNSDGETTDSTGEVEIEVTRGSEGRRRDERADRSADTDGRDDDSTVREYDRNRGRGRDRDRDSLDHLDHSDTTTSDDPPSDRDERDLADELGRIDIMTTPEGYVEGRITDVTAVDATTVRLTVALPHGETSSFTLEKPIPWSDEFLLARLVEDVGYDAASIDHVVGESVYLVRTDTGPEETDDEDWWTASVQAASDVLLSSLSGGRYRIERDATPEWRLVDPLERPDATTETNSTDTANELLGTGLILFGTIVAAAGAVFGATGELVVSSSVVGYAVLGLLLVLTGLVVLLDRELSDFE